jgi:hypothetical protein
VVRSHGRRCQCRGSAWPSSAPLLASRRQRASLWNISLVRDRAHCAIQQAPAPPSLSGVRRRADGALPQGTHRRSSPTMCGAKAQGLQRRQRREGGCPWEFCGTGLAPRGGPCVSRTAPDPQERTRGKEGTTIAPAPSARDVHHDCGMSRRREPWAHECHSRHLAMRNATNTGSASTVRSGVRRRALGPRKPPPSRKWPRGVRCPAARYQRGRQTQTASTRVRQSWRFLALITSSATFGYEA